jgi:hypothetical protein
MKKNKQSQGECRLCPPMSSERARELMTDPQKGAIVGNGNPLSVQNAVGYPDSILTITKRKSGIAFSSQYRNPAIKAGKK